MLTFKQWNEGIFQKVGSLLKPKQSAQNSANLANRVKRVTAGSNAGDRKSWMGSTQPKPGLNKSVRMEDMSSSVPANNAGSGNVDGIGVGLKGEPGKKKKKLRAK